VAAMVWPSFLLDQCTQDCRAPGSAICCSSQCSPFPLGATPYGPFDAHLIATDDATSTAEPSEVAESRSGASSARSKASLCTGNRLEVPACFPVRRDPSTDKQQCDMARPPRVDQLLQSFTHTMQRGAEMRVLLDDGKLLDVEASLDPDMTRLILGVKEVTREILFADIERVSGPEDSEESCTTNSDHLSKCCTTLVLSSTHFLTFSFENERQCDYFEVCFRAILASQQTAAANPDP